MLHWTKSGNALIITEVLLINITGKFPPKAEHKILNLGSKTIDFLRL